MWTETKWITPTYLNRLIALWMLFPTLDPMLNLQEVANLKRRFLMRKMWVLQSCHCVESVKCRTYKLSARPSNDKTWSCTHPADLLVCYLICTKKRNWRGHNKRYRDSLLWFIRAPTRKNYNASHLNSTKTHENSCGRNWREVLSFLFLVWNVGGV